MSSLIYLSADWCLVQLTVCDKSWKERPPVNVTGLIKRAKFIRTSVSVQCAHTCVFLIEKSQLYQVYIVHTCWLVCMCACVSDKVSKVYQGQTDHFLLSDLYWFGVTAALVQLNIYNPNPLFKLWKHEDYIGVWGLMYLLTWNKQSLPTLAYHSTHLKGTLTLVGSGIFVIIATNAVY